MPDVARSEILRIRRRRAVLALDDAVTTPRDALALALSGGGIRSATFCLGLLQSLARKGALHGFDYLSTVSGGGYAGAFFGSLFTRHAEAAKAQDPRASAADPYVVMSGPSHRPAAGTSSEPAPSGWQLWWLRNSGRYLAPTGAGDYLYAVALALRNLLAIHFVLGLSALLLALPTMIVDEGLRAVLRAIDLSGSIPGLGFAWLALAGALFWVLPLGVAYFGTEMPKPGVRQHWWRTRTRLELTLIGVAGLLIGLALAPQGMDWVPIGDEEGGGFWRAIGIDFDGSWGLASIFAAIGAVALLASGFVGSAAIEVQRRADRDAASVARRDAVSPQGLMLSTRVLLTKRLAFALKVDVLLLAIAVLIGGGCWLAIWLSKASAAAQWFSSMTGIGGTVLLTSVRKAAGQLLDPKAAAAPRVPMNSLALLVGMLAAGLLTALWFALGWWAAGKLSGVTLSNSLHLTPQMLGLLAVLLPVALAAGHSFQFLNLSSIQNLYSSRLVRAYLGATNPARADSSDPRWAHLSDTHPDDNLSLARYYAPGNAAPLHLINTTLNETVSPNDPLVQRDRHGRPLTVSPDHLCVDGDFYRRLDDTVPPTANARQRMARWFSRLGRGMGPAVAPESMSLGSWIGISGAAFSTGVGRGTTLGKALLLGLANVRLGHWWDAAMLERRPARQGADTLMRMLSRLFRTQAYLVAELTGRFSGRYSRYWYLSDGGHFDNTGIYELLRRRVGFIVCADNGADDQYTHDDIANLMRVARIDFGCEFRRIEAHELAVAGPDGARWARLLLSSKGARDASLQLDPAVARLPRVVDEPQPARGDFSDVGCLSIHWVSYPDTPDGSVLVVVKPRLVAGVPTDVQQYAQVSPSFPQESTVDQFFSEEQWESYRKLGEVIGAVIGGGDDAGADAAAGMARWRELRKIVEQGVVNEQRRWSMTGAAAH